MTKKDRIGWKVDNWAGSTRRSVRSGRFSASNYSAATVFTLKAVSVAQITARKGLFEPKLKRRAGLVVWVERVGLELGEIRRPARETNILGSEQALINKNSPKTRCISNYTKI